jgi:hypothetical protein
MLSSLFASVNQSQRKSMALAVRLAVKFSSCGGGYEKNSLTTYCFSFRFALLVQFDNLHEVIHNLEHLYPYLSTF